MVEDYLLGTEYRFFVLGNRTFSCLITCSTNVIGDGVHLAFAELVAAKNNHVYGAMVVEHH